MRILSFHCVVSPSVSSIPVSGLPPLMLYHASFRNGPIIDPCILSCCWQLVIFQPPPAISPPRSHTTHAQLIDCAESLCSPRGSSPSAPRHSAPVRSLPAMNAFYHRVPLVPMPLWQSK